MNLPNKLTTLRLLIAIALVVIYSIFKDASWIMWFVGSAFIVGSLTDFLDGIIARKFNLVTGFGKLMDPLADKLLVISTIIILIHANIIPTGQFWLVLIVIARELLVLGVRLAALEGGGEVVAANWIGKAKTTAQMVSISGLCIIAAICEFYNMETPFLDTMHWIFLIMFYVSVLLCVIGGVVYFIQNKKYFKMK